jgi:3'(2'), 5'-bisphosphate nucleotidase
MSPARESWVRDEDLAARLAGEAGRLLIELRAGGAMQGSALGRVADQVSNAFILSALRQWRPGDAILSEESCDDLVRLEAERVWIIDPLDGTREYGEGRPDWAVHVALAIGGAPRIGAVSVPARGQLFRSDDAPPTVAPRHSARPFGGAEDRPLMLVSRTRPPEMAAELADWLGADVTEMGSAGAKAMAVIAGKADLYFHAGGQHEWDNCAPAAVALGLGLHASRIDGAPLVYNRADTLVPDLLIARPELVPRILAFTQR